MGESIVSRRTFVQTAVAAGVAASGVRATTQPARPATSPVDSANSGNLADGSGASGSHDRARWVSLLAKIATPVLEAAAAGKLHELMPVEVSSAGKLAERAAVTHLEAVGRVLAGMAPWFENGEAGGDEGEKRRSFVTMARAALDRGTDPASPDRLNFTDGHQPLVDAAFLAHALLRAPHTLWETLDPRVQKNIFTCLRATRAETPGANNWVLFSAMIEAALLKFGADDWDSKRIDYALRQHELWYKGDGMYGDGARFHWDYYNSFVIHPMLVDILTTVGKRNGWETLYKPVLTRARRYAVIQERLINPDGTFPAIGRSLAYRCGAFQLLAQMSLRKELPAEIPPAQARGALTAVIRRTLEAPGAFDDRGWLKIGLCGAQPSIGESYISTGSLYLCSTAFLPLGLPATDPFWADPPRAWTSVRMWSGEDVPSDHSIS